MSNETASARLPGGMSASAFSGLFEAVNGLRNHRAVLAMVGCTVVGVLIVGLLLSVGGFLGGLLGSLVWFVAVGTGINAAGTLHMDHARGISPRSTVDALVFGLMCIPKLIVLGLALFAIALVVFIVLAVLFLICKIPFLGALLFAIVFPLSVVIAGVTMFGLFLCMALSLPAIWQGATITRALAQTLAIARSRLVEAMLLLVFVSFLGLAVSLIVFSVLGFGLMPTLGLSASIVGFGGGGLGQMGGLGGLMGMAQGFGGGGHVVAGMIGMFVLWAIALSLVTQVHLLGLCLVYLRVTEGLDLSGTEEALRRSFDDARRRTAELGEKAKTATQRATADTTASRTGSVAGPPIANAPMTGSAVAAAASSASASASGSTSAPIASAAPPPFKSAAAEASPPPAFAAAPSPAETSAPFFPPLSPHEQSLPPYLPEHDGPDISLPFDDVTVPGSIAPASAPAAGPAAQAAQSVGAPPAQPPASPVVGSASPPAVPAARPCPQCLSPVRPDDLFCGVCGYRLK